MNQNYLLSVFFFLFSVTVISQEKNATLYGKVHSHGKPLTEATIYLDKTSVTSETNHKGSFVLKALPGKYTVICSAFGFQTKKIEITLLPNSSKELNISLNPDHPIGLNEVSIKGKSAIKQVKESPFNIVALDAKSQYNTTLDLAHLLDKASGVKIRETGGVGSDMSISLNGFTGRHIKLFMDGIPMQGFGSAFQLNNIPVGIADRIEVYKGVVPVEFGADALGGAINIVTNQSANTYMDLSYSYGSFNTHKTNINFGFTDKSGFTVQVNAFQNYSDNSYKVFVEDILDVNNGTYSIHNKWAKRFHDTYHNETAILKTGFVKKWWADRFLIGVTFGQEYADIQTANMMKIVYGKKFRTSNTIMPSITYEKNNLFTKGLNFRLTANYNKNKNHNNDTINRQYNWFGDYRVTGSAGESATSTLADYYNDNYSATANLNYRINNKHSISINDVITGYERKNDITVSSAELGVTYDNMRRISQKNVLGLSYRYRFNEKWNFDLFGKNYQQKVIGPINDGDIAHPSYLELEKNYATSGYGFATTYFLKDIQLKASVEKAYRLPTENELFGDEVLETGNAAIKAENSMNYNVGATLNKELNSSNSIYADINLYYRDTQDYIRRIIEQRNGSGGSINHGTVHNMGIDAELRYYYKNKFTIGGNVTYQDLRDKERYVASTSGLRESLTYDIRIPNVPYFFGNADAAYYIHDLWKKGNVLTAGYSLNFVGEFFLNWENLGSSNNKLVLPQQLSHDLNVTFSAAKGKYNIAFEARNITNELLYDNYALQKAGRNFSVKLRYFFMERRK
ncbi:MULTISPECIES: TonB-dependent receptor [Flavobacterium]|uniref:TonB-dependent receptor n=1 Tax=Flavobacterium TaxID=237 RepID=UPI001184620F|nr:MULTISPECIES: TonB-dependent receptor plug domain-containing protein [Flavobacterium]MCR4029768.1 TonB-dependent receptor [Flavobacterium panacis]